ncbi:hypothetical protein GGTG_10583 [Gaeumannomyces tritici R3-111a-1]|uniref:Uncharacterized protein n=1 Tax=Gaeumannomyces tritici (strain R3-111a-1) TaxID=644352 RepID=J3PAQ8_GAET3|nr:hypothetical protein GGTG_10583 [Gaeumannomyces tritici R3-111a-1]EJT71324.1 hypothetical protein GGTG_10583 [Gaeumannomyces tritici R3-111a-1]
MTTSLRARDRFPLPGERREQPRPDRTAPRDSRRDRQGVPSLVGSEGGLDPPIPSPVRSLPALMRRAMSLT